MGVDQVARDLLEHQEQNDEHQCLPGVRDGDEQRAHTAADKGAHDGDQGRQGDEDAYQHGIGQSENRHGHHEQRTQDDCLQALAGEEAGESTVGKAQNFQRPVRPFHRQQAIEHLAPLAGQLFLLQQDVEGEDQPDDKCTDSADHTANQATAGGQQAAAPGLGQLDGLLGKALPVDFQAVDDALDLGQVLLQAHQLLLQAVQGRRDLTGNGQHRILHAGTDDAGGQRQHPDHRHQGQHQGQRAAQADAPLRIWVQVPLNGPHGHIQDKGDGGSQQEGRQNAQHPAAGCRHCRQVLQGAVEGYAAANDQQQALQIFFIPFHTRFLSKMVGINGCSTGRR